MTWFRCKECGYEFEELVNLPDELTVKCEKCKSEANIDSNFIKKIHRDGAKYRNGSWSSWQAGN
jgi:putative FmdB family regulatory protein